MKLRSLLLAASLMFVSFGFVSDSTPAQNDDITIVSEVINDAVTVVYQSVPQNFEAPATKSSSQLATINYSVSTVTLVSDKADNPRESEYWVSEKVPIYTYKG